MGIVSLGELGQDVEGECLTGSQQRAEQEATQYSCTHRFALLSAAAAIHQLWLVGQDRQARVIEAAKDCVKGHRLVHQELA